MIYDAFMFFNELELLEIRLHELSRYVDRFVLVECSWTHQNRDKLFYFAENQERFAEFADRIIHVKVTDKPARTTPEVLEPFHRNCLLRGLEDAAADDVVMVSDLDEIPRGAAIQEYFDGDGQSMCFEQGLYYYYVNCHMCQCTGTRIATVEQARERTPQKLRHSDHFVIKNGGWHFSYLGGAEAIRAKTRAFCHPGCASPRFMNDAHLAHVLATGEDLFKRGDGKGRFLALDDTWPRFLVDNQDIFAHFIKEV